MLNFSIYFSIILGVTVVASGAEDELLGTLSQQSTETVDAATPATNTPEIVVPAKFPSPSEVDRMEFEYLIDGMKAARESIAQATVTYTGNRRRTDKRDPSRNIDGRIEGMMAFDVLKQKLRIEHSMPESYGDDISESEFKALSDSGDLKEFLHGPSVQTDQFIMFVKNESYSAEYEKTGIHDSNLNISTPDWPLGENRDLLHLIDYRSLGMIDVQDYSGWRPWLIYDGSTLELDNSSLLCPVETVIHNIRVRNYFRLIKKSGLVTIDWGPHTLTIDERNGFTPVEYRTTDAYREMFNCTHSATTSWGQVSGHWVPTNAVLEMNNEKHETIERFELHLEWSGINEALPEELFEYESFKNVEDETYVIDSRTGSPGLLGEWIGGKLQTRFAAQPPPPRSSRLIIVVSLTLFIVLVLLLVRARSRFHSGANRGSGSAE